MSTVFGLKLEYSAQGPGGGTELRELVFAFERFGAELPNTPRHVFKHLIAAVEEFTKRQFKAEGLGPVAGKWRELSPKYKAWKEARYPGKPILERTGALKAALTESSSPHAYRAYDNTSFAFGTRGLPYATYHSDRPVLDFDAKFEKAVQRASVLGMRDAVKEAKAEVYLSMVISPGEEETL